MHIHAHGSLGINLAMDHWMGEWVGYQIYLLRSMQNASPISNVNGHGASRDAYAPRSVCYTQGVRTKS